MKKIIISLVAILIFKIGFSQNGSPLYPITQNLGSSSSLVDVKGGQRINGAFVLGHFVDTAAANAIPYVKNFANGLITTDTSLVWLRSYDAKKWLLMPTQGRIVNGDSINYLVDVNRPPGQLNVYGKFFNGISAYSRLLYTDSIGSGGGSSYTFPYSVVAPGSAIQFKNDTADAAPISVYYGTNSLGRFGYYPQSGITGVNFYNSDGTLSGNRTVTGANFNLLFSGINGFTAEGNTISLQGGNQFLHIVGDTANFDKRVSYSTDIDHNAFTDHTLVDKDYVDNAVYPFDATVSFSVNADPNTVGTTFNPNTPQLDTKVYVSTIDGSLWTWNGVAYVIYNSVNWGIFGNAGTDPTTNFIGTTDSKGLLFKTANIQSGYIDIINNNTSFGVSSLASNTTGSFNSAFGGSSLTANVSGVNNTAIGNTAMYQNSSGSYNTAIGEQSLFYNLDSSNNIAIGYKAGYNAEDLSKRLYINSLDRTNILGDTTKSIIYGAQDATAANQRLYLNSQVYAPYLSTGVGTKAVRYDEATGQFLVADTTSGGGSSGITVGTTTITSGTNGRIGYNNSGVYGEYAINGTGNVVMSSAQTDSLNGYWRQTGSAITGSPFIGTTNNRSLDFKTNNILKFTIDSNYYLRSKSALIFDGGGQANRAIYFRADSSYYIKDNSTNGRLEIGSGGGINITAPTGALTLVQGGATNFFMANTGKIAIGGGLFSPSDALEVNGNVALKTAGNKIKITTGTNASVGQSAAMTAGSITISTTAVTSSSLIFLTHANVGGTPGILSVGTITNGTSFVINSTSALDTSLINWWIVN